MKCPDCYGLGYIVIMRPAVFGQPIQSPPICIKCDGTGVVPDPKPVRVHKPKSMRRLKSK